jgi:hypothetical protein
MFRIHWNCPPFNITMGVPFAHGAQKDGFWQPCGDYHRHNLITTPDNTKHARPFKGLASLHNFFKKLI